MTILNIVFRLINFGILIWLVVHVFLKYFYHDFKVQVRRQLDWWLALRDDIMQVRIKQKELDVAIAHEQWEAERLLDNLMRWQAWSQKEQQLKKQAVDEQMHRLHERRKQQEKNYQETILARHMVPKLFSAAHHVLCQEYIKHSDKIKQFEDKTINQLKKVS